jgi:hypothetical protein
MTTAWTLALASLLAVSSVGESAPPRADLVGVEQRAMGCFYDEARRSEWARDGDAFTWGERTLRYADMIVFWNAIVGARRGVPELLGELGITRESLAAHRDEVLALALPDAFRGAPLPPEVEPPLAWERLAPLIRDELLGKNGSGTESQQVRVTFRLDGRELVAESHGLGPWMLPWTVSVDGRTFTSEDPAVARAVLALVDPAGPCLDDLDGDARWPDSLWKDEWFWFRSLRQELDQALSREQYTQLLGWSRASERFAVQSVMTGRIDRLPEAMVFELEARFPAVLDVARWHDFFADGALRETWDIFLALHARAEGCAEQQSWLSEWKALDPKRHVGLVAAGTSGCAESRLEELVLPAWVDAGFSGQPEFELSLREDQILVGTLYLSSRLSGAVITSAHRERALTHELPSKTAETATSGAKSAVPHHWFDDLVLSCSPTDNAPGFARVGADGRVEVRTLSRALGRHPR